MDQNPRKPHQHHIATSMHLSHTIYYLIPHNHIIMNNYLYTRSKVYIDHIGVVGDLIANHNSMLKSIDVIDCNLYCT
jgi:hypothetical protein